METFFNEGTLKVRMPDRVQFSCVNECKSDIWHYKDVSKVILDFAGTSYIDSSGLGLILIIRDKLSKNIDLINCNLIVLEVFKNANFHKLFTISR